MSTILADGCSAQHPVLICSHRSSDILHCELCTTCLLRFGHACEAEQQISQLIGVISVLGKNESQHSDPISVQRPFPPHSPSALFAYFRVSIQSSRRRRRRHGYLFVSTMPFRLAAVNNTAISDSPKFRSGPLFTNDRTSLDPRMLSFKWPPILCKTSGTRESPVNRYLLLLALRSDNDHYIESGSEYCCPWTASSPFGVRLTLSSRELAVIRSGAQPVGINRPSPTDTDISRLGRG